MKIKTPGKIAILLVVIGIAYGAFRMISGGGGGFLSGIMPGAKERESTVPLRADLPPMNPSGSVVNNPNMAIPTSRPAGNTAGQVRLLLWAWNAQLGGLFANGGVETTEGSLMAKQGVNLKYIRQDDPTKMQEELVTFATELSRGNAQPDIGAHFVAIMGDGSASFLDGVNRVLEKLGPEYRAKVIGSMGYSRGEDKFMGPQSWKDNPSAAKGGVVSGYLRDGDWNIALKWLGDNGLKNNPDEKTYDPDALNWVSANDYIDAAEKYIAGYSETRPVVRNGRRTGETKQITVQGVVTWTPGDVTIARQKGGLVSIVSTREYSSQMPNTIIGIDKWMKSNRSKVENMLEAMFMGGDALKASGPALAHAAKIADEVFSEPDTGAEYWEKYYRGVIETDKQGLTVELGGSSVNNLADNMVLFGLVPGSQNLFEATYTVFGNIVKQQYPDMLSSFDKASLVTDTSYVRSLSRRSAPTTTEIAKASPIKPMTGAPPKRVVSRKSWRIRFATGKATFTAEAASQLGKLMQDLLIAGNTVVEIHGHTDNAGNADSNMKLSEARAFAVKSWIEKRARVNFPEGKIRIFAHGQVNPVAPNGSEAGKAQNRRVEIVLRAGD
jgi:outer membrane protein OmpA-like peptidoglycan-associated protein